MLISFTLHFVDDCHEFQLLSNVMFINLIINIEQGYLTMLLGIQQLMYYLTFVFCFI
jgi:hypothetical protein